MNKSFLYILLFCIVGTNLYSMEEGGNYPTSFIRKNMVPAISTMNPGKEETDDESSSGDESDEDVNDAFEFAPQQIKDVIHLIKTQRKSKELYKCLILTGNPGTGKTILSKAICKELNRSYKFILTSALLEDVRNRTAKKIKNIFLNWKKSKKPRPVLIFDEIMAFFEGYASESNDSQENSKVFWQCYDKYKKYQDFLVLGTANGTTGMDVPLQSRLRRGILVVSESGLDNRVKMLQKKIDEFDEDEKDETINETFLREFAAKLDGFSYRDIETLVLNTNLISYSENRTRDKVLFSRKYFEMALAQWEDQNKTIVNMERKEAAEDRRHKESMEDSRKSREQAAQHHQESMNQNRQQHQQNQEQQDSHQWKNRAIQIGFGAAGVVIGIAGFIITGKIINANKS